MMRCNFFDGSFCNEVGYVYCPTVEEQKGICETEDFRNCTRFLAYLDILSST